MDVLFGRGPIRVQIGRPMDVHHWTWTSGRLMDVQWTSCAHWAIGVGLSMKVLGGSWQDQEPAQRNIMLINTLADTFLKYLQ